MYYFIYTEIPERGTVQNILLPIGAGSVVTFPDVADNIGPEREAYLAWVAEGNTPEPWPPAE